MNTTIRARATEPATSQQAEGRRPMLDPATAMLIRSSGDLQLGWDPDRAVLIRPPRGVPASAVATLLDRADGSTSYANLVTAAVSIGIGPEEMAELINELVAMGVLSWAPPPQLTRAAHLHVHGRGPLSDAISQGLALGGQQPSRSHGRLPARRGYPELVILADELVCDPCVVSELVAAHINHLSVRLRDGIGMVGPLVLPGRTSCLRCADLHRADHDPEWPMLAAQLLGRAGHGSAGAVRATAGFALGQIEQLLDGHTGAPVPRTVNATIEVDPRLAQLRRRVWSPHPRCGCGAHR